MAGRTEFEREKEEGFIKSRKLAKLVERYKIELNEARLEIRDLKARLLESSDIHVSYNKVFGLSEYNKVSKLVTLLYMSHMALYED